MARNYRREYDSYHSSETQKKNRAGRNAARNSLKASGSVKKGDVWIRRFMIVMVTAMAIKLWIG